MGTFAESTTVTSANGGFKAELWPEWEIWGPNGGYLSAIALRAAGKLAPNGHRPVTYSCQYLSSPRSGGIDIAVETAKVGRSAACLNVRLIQDGRVALQAQVWTTNRDAGPERRDLAAPSVPSPHALRPIEDYLPKDRAVHPFWAHFEARPTHFLAEGEQDARGAVMETWYRHLGFEGTDDGYLDSARALVLIDTVPWPTFALAQGRRLSYIAPTLDLTVWFHDLPGKADWLLVDGHAGFSRAGLIHGGARVWSEDGRLLATGGSQLLVVERR